MLCFILWLTAVSGPAPRPFLQQEIFFSPFPTIADTISVPLCLAILTGLVLKGCQLVATIVQVIVSRVDPVNPYQCLRTQVGVCLLSFPCVWPLVQAVSSSTLHVISIKVPKNPLAQDVQYFSDASEHTTDVKTWNTWNCKYKVVRIGNYLMPAGNMARLSLQSFH